MLHNILYFSPVKSCIVPIFIAIPETLYAYIIFITTRLQIIVFNTIMYHNT